MSESNDPIRTTDIPSGTGSGAATDPVPGADSGSGISLSSADGACDEPDCMATLRELDVFLDGELSHQAQSSIRHHLDDCPDCNHAFDFHAELKTVIQKKCLDEEMPPGLLTRIEQCFDTELDLDLDLDLDTDRGIDVGHDSGIDPGDGRGTER